MKSSHRVCTTCCVNTAPMLARTASTENGSAQSSSRISPPAPTASPVRSIVPRLPGSRSAWATSQIGARARSIRASAVSNSANTPATACGLSLPVILARISSSVSITSPPSRRHGRFQRGQQRMIVAPARHHKHFGQVPAFARVGQQAQALGQELALALAVLLVAQRAEQLDRRVGETGNRAAVSQGRPGPRFSLRRSRPSPARPAGAGSGRPRHLRP